MTKIFKAGLALALLTSISLTTFAQKAFEGTVSYAITYIELPAEVQGMESMLPQESKMTMKGAKVRIEQNIMGGSQIVIADNENMNSNILMDMMGQKIALSISKEEMEDAAKNETPADIEYLSETKTVAGYKCKKAKVTYPGEEGSNIVWYTEKFKGQSHNQFKGLNGLPLEYETSKDNMTLRMVAQEVKQEKVADNAFVVPDGYQTMTMEEMQQMMGGGQ